MKFKTISLAASLALLAIQTGFSQDTTTHKNPLSLTPELARATMAYGYGTIPFILRNDSTEEIEFLQDWHNFVEMMTTNNSGEKVTLLDFQDPGGVRISEGPEPSPIRLKPATSGTYVAEFSMDTLAYAASKGKKIFGELAGHFTTSKQSFDLCSEPFAVPAELTKSPWNDLGKQAYLKITVDPTQPWERTGTLSFPIKITNIAEQPLMVNSVHVSFCHGEDDRKSGPVYWEPDLWELVRDLSPSPPLHPDERPDKEPILKPGESIMAGGRSYFIVGSGGTPAGWKVGDHVVVAVGGRIPGTNKVFESYSEPFVFPAMQHK